MLYGHSRQPLIDTAPGTFESLVGSLLGGYQDQHELKRRRQIEDQDRLAAEEERKRQQARQDAADADSRTSFDLGMSKEGYSRDTVVSAPDPNIVAAPTLGHLGNFTRTGLSDADRSITREAADKVAAAEVERQRRIRIGKALGAPDRASALAMLAQDAPDAAIKTWEEQGKPKNIDPLSQQGIAATNATELFKRQHEYHEAPAPIQIPGVDKNGNPIVRLVDRHGKEITTFEGGKPVKSTPRQELARSAIGAASAANAEYEKDLAQGGPINQAEIQQIQNIFSHASGKPKAEIMRLLVTGPMSERARRMGVNAFEMAYGLASSRGRAAAETINEHLIAILSNDTQRKQVLPAIRTLAGEGKGRRPSDDLEN